jgi:hypothetical protein
MFPRGHFPGCSAVRESDNPHRPVDRRPLSLPSSRPSARRARRAGTQLLALDAARPWKAGPSRDWLDAARPACRSPGCWVPALRASRSGRDDGDGYPPAHNSPSIAGRQAGVGAFQTRSVRPTPLSPSSRPSARRARRAGTQRLALDAARPWKAGPSRDWLDAARPACRSRGCWVPALRASRSGRDDGDGEWRMYPHAHNPPSIACRQDFPILDQGQVSESCAAKRTMARSR